MQKQADPWAFDGNHPACSPTSGSVPCEVQPLLKGGCPKLLVRLFDRELQQLSGAQDDNWHLVSDIPDFNNLDFRKVTCTCHHKKPTGIEHDFESMFDYQPLNQEAILYRSCKRTILAAAKRQVKSAPTPDPKVVKAFLAFAKDKIRYCMGDDLTHFGYSFNQWFNHLNSAKQQRMALVHEYIHGTPLPGFKQHSLVELFKALLPGYSGPMEYYRTVEQLPAEMLRYKGICKVEIQSVDGKPRMVCSIPDLIKYVMGPICWRLEEMAADHLPVYCGGMNLSEMEDKINHYIDQGFDLVAQGDGSAFDNTQDVSLKELDRWIYRQLYPFIHHVPRELFALCSQLIYKVMDINLRDQITGKTSTLMRYAVCGTVFSGDCDTTLMNTIRMGMYNWFTNESMGLELGTHYVCWSKGDDFTVIYNRRLVDEQFIRRGYYRLWLSKPSKSAPGCSDLYDSRQYGLGQILKMLDFGGPNSFAFCSLNAWYTNYGTGHIVLTRNVAKLFNLGNYSRKIKCMTNLAASQYLVDQAEALLVSYGGIHIFDEAAQCLLKRADMFRRAACYNKFRKRGSHDPRITLALENHLEQSIFHITFRNKYRNILHNASYWETVKSYEMVREKKLTGSALECVNSQIDALYPPGELRRLLNVD